MADLAKLVVRLEAQSAQFLSELEKANRRIDRFASQTGKTLNKWANGLVATFSARAILGFANDVLSAQDSLADMSKETGVAVESLSRYGYAAEQSGSDVESLNKSLGKLAKTAVDAAEGGKESAAAFATIGVSVKKTDGSLRTTEEILLDTAQAFSEYEDGLAKSDLAQKIFGKSGAELIPFLNEGRAGIEALAKRADELGITISTKAATAADEFNDKLSELGAVARGVMGRALQEVIPIIERLTDGMLNSAGATDSVQRAAEFVATGFKLLLTAATVVIGVFDALGTAIGNVAAGFAKLASFDIRGAVEVFSQLKQDVVDNGVDTGKELAAIWSDTAAASLKPMTKFYSDLDSLTADSLTAAGEASKKAKKVLQFDGDGTDTESARKSLQQYLDTLREQAKGLDEGSAAAARYKLEVGALADEVKAAGEEGQRLKLEIISAAEAKEQADRVKKLGEVQKSAIESLMSLRDQLHEQAVGFDESAAGAIRYRLEVGSLAKEVRAAGAAGESLKLEIISAAEAAQQKADLKDIQDGLAGINSQILELQGRSGESALIQFDKENAELLKKLRREGDEAGQQQVATLRELIGAQAEYNELEKQSQRIQDDLANAEERINNSRAVGAITGLDALQQLDAARAAAVVQLDAINQKQMEIAQSSGSDTLAQAAKNAAQETENLRAQTDLLGQSIRSNLVDAGAGFFKDLTSGAKSFEDAGRDAIQSIANDLLDLAARNLAEQIFGGMSAGGGWLGAAAAVLGGSRDSGGRGRPGVAYSIGTGAQPETFVPDQPGTFKPADSGPDEMVRMTNNFYVQTSDGRLSMETQQQASNRFASVLAQSRRRNG